MRPPGQTPLLTVSVALAILISGIVPASVRGGEQTNNAFGISGLSVVVGAAANSRTEATNPNSGLAWAFAEADFRSPTWYRLQINASVLATPTIGQEEPGIADSIFVEPTDLRTFNLGLTSDDAHQHLWLGRKAFPGNPVLDGDSQQGLGMSFKIAPQTQLNLTAINRWIKYSTTSDDAWGITGWNNVNKANARASDLYLAVGLDAIAITDRLQLSPFIDYQDNVLAVYGTTVNLSLPMGDSSNQSHWNTEAILAYYQNQVPTSLRPDYQDVRAARVHTGLISEHHALGAGLYWLSDERNDIGAGLFSDFDPLQEDNLYPYNDKNNVTLFYLDGRLQVGRLQLQSALGIGRNDAVDSDSIELDLFFKYSINNRLTLGGYLVHVDFSANAMPNYTKIGASLNYLFQ